MILVGFCFGFVTHQNFSIFARNGKMFVMNDGYSVVSYARDGEAPSMHTAFDVQPHQPCGSHINAGTPDPDPDWSGSGFSNRGRLRVRKSKPVQRVGTVSLLWLSDRICHCVFCLLEPRRTRSAGYRKVSDQYVLLMQLLRVVDLCNNDKMGRRISSSSFYLP